MDGPLSAVEWQAERQAYDEAKAHGFPCAGCGKTWTGMRRCHCGECHQTFSSTSAFSRHRSHFQCQPAADRGLVLIEDVWHLPGERPVLPSERVPEAAEALVSVLAQGEPFPPPGGDGAGGSGDSDDDTDGGGPNGDGPKC